MKLIIPQAQILVSAAYGTMLQIVSEAISYCYGKEPPATKSEQERSIRARIKAGHESVIEHVGFSAALIVDRGITHELVRHRLCSFTQESTRFCSYENHITFVMPPEVAKAIPNSFCYSDAQIKWGGMTMLELTDGGWVDVVPYSAYAWAEAMLQAERQYHTLLNQCKWSPEQARGVLPTATAARIVMTANMREWRHIFKLRALGETGRPHPQMVQIMQELLGDAKDRFPVFFEDL